MGLSFPRRFLRQALGPKLVNNYPVEKPESDIGDTTFNAEFWATAGMNLIVPRVQLIATWNGSVFVIAHQAEAWNADGGQAHPALARASAGRYSYTFAAAYNDEDGQAVAVDLKGARCDAMRVMTTPTTQRVGGYAWIDPAAPLVVQIALIEEAGPTLADHPFWLEVS